MAKPTVPDLKELFKQAAEIAQQVPEAMQAAAFNRAVDLLTGAGTSPLAPQTRLATQPSSSAAARLSKKGRGETGTLDSLLESIDSTQHPSVRSTSTVLDRSLMVLQIARAEHNVDGLTPGDVARILTDKFRVSTSDAAVRMAFGNASNLVNRVPRGNGFVYRIMGPGEEHLAHLSQSDATSQGKAPIRKRHRRTAGTKVAESTGAAAKSDPTNGSKGDLARKAAKRKGGASGPVVTLNELMESGFLEKHRTLMELIEHCRTNKAKAFRADQLSGPLARAVRDGRLKRQKNNDGQYEYWK